MIQCETCKVWQHCPCVGLGDGEVTPDKYYCDSCRPENHPYRVVNGQLVTNTKTAAKPTKKRSTMNSKEASIPMDLMLAQQKWNEEHQDEIDMDFPVRTTSKRRRKTESSTTDIDDDHNHNGQLSLSDALTASNTTTNSKKKDSNDDQESVSTSSSHKSTSSHHRNTTKRNSAKSISKVRSRSSSPNTNNNLGSDSRKELSPSTEASSSSSSGHKNSRSYDNGSVDAKTMASSESSASSTKRRKTMSKSEISSRPGSATVDEDDDTISKNASDTELSETTMRTPKSGTKTSSKRNHGQHDHPDSREESASGHQQTPTVSSPGPMTTKKGYSRRGGDRAHSARIGSRHSTPAPGEGTPQPMTPAAPTVVRYPSPKMTLQEMTKRAKQMLDYISRVQVELADHKSRITPSASPEAHNSSASTAARRPLISSSTAHRTSLHDDMDVDVKKLSEGRSFGFRLPMPVVSTSGHGVHYGDNQVCPDLSRSSMDSTSSTVDGMQEPSSPVDMKVPTSSNGHTKDLNMTIKVVPMDSQDSSLLLSTPPLSVHDHHHPHHPHHSSGSPDSDVNHEPLTPPHQPLDGSHDSQQDQQGHSSEKKPNSITSMDLMDKLTGDLIRFQEKFGAFA
ncbi:hypothetical protein FBU30_006624 [Linnemannia zychae]|nr:hypothetical protein FBU30_006624 [Linnemannia zychae]